MLLNIAGRGIEVSRHIPRTFSHRHFTEHFSWRSPYITAGRAREASPHGNAMRSVGMCCDGLCDEQCWRARRWRRWLLPAAERYLHVKVDDTTKGESVNVNLPLSMAETILPTVNNGSLHNGHVTVGQGRNSTDVDVRALLDAIRTTPDNEFVTVKEKDQDVRVAKSNGNLDCSR